MTKVPKSCDNNNAKGINLKARELFLIFAAIIFFSCERVDMFNEGAAYSSIIAWFIAGKNTTYEMTTSIAKWEDEYGSSNYFYQTAGYPVIASGTPASKPVISFMGSQSLKSNTDSELKYPLCIMFVAGEFGNGPIISSKTNNSEDFVIAYGTANFNIMTAPNYGAASSLPDTAYRVITVQINEEKILEVFENKNLILSTTVSQSDIFLRGILIGKDPVPNWATFKLAELILFERVLSDKSREQFITDLMGKYNL